MTPKQRQALLARAPKSDTSHQICTPMLKLALLRPGWQLTSSFSWPLANRGDQHMAIRVATRTPTLLA